MVDEGGNVYVMVIDKFKDYLLGLYEWLIFLFILLKYVMGLCFVRWDFLKIFKLFWIFVCLGCVGDVIWF